MIEEPQRLPADLELVAPGPQLAALLASVDRERLSGGDRLRLAQARNRMASHVQAELLADLHAVTFEEPPAGEEVSSQQASRYQWAEVEVALAMRWTRAAAGGRLEQARQLIEDFPQVQQALTSGAIDVPKALVIADVAGWLDDRDAARRVVDQVIDKAPGWTTGQLRARLRRLVLAIDPAAARRRCATAVKTRRVEMFANEDGTGEVWGEACRRRMRRQRGSG